MPGSGLIRPTNYAPFTFVWRPCSLIWKKCWPRIRRNGNSSRQRGLNEAEPPVTDKVNFAGGIRLGFEAHGGKCVFTSEWNTYCQQTYKANFNDDHEILGDITRIRKPAVQIPDFDVLLAGFPCQPFSIAGVSKKNALGRPHGFACETQGTLFFDVVRIIKAKRPKAFLLENVKNLVSHDKGNTFRTIMKVLEKQLKYKVTYKVIDGQHFVPQHRERILIVGFREETGFDWNALHLPDKDRQSIMTVLHPGNGTEDPEEPYTVGAKARVNPKYTLTDHLWSYLQNYAAKHRAAGNGFGYGLVGPNISKIARTLSARYYKDGSEILVYQGKRKNPRRLTPRECARLMGFDQNGKKFIIPVSDTQAYKQFGNSIVVPVVEEVARIMKPHIMKLIECDTSGIVQRDLFVARNT
ncbi:MAG: DNA (cytosine-5-)-methyltransferase [Proteobacteria bacterium]|nr:DNA (cytosine-5-)-methyltransferase [Pseudomonadota bacterium]